MTLVLVSADMTAATRNLSAVGARGQQLTPALNRIIQTQRDSVRQEFEQEAGFLASGQLVSWPAVRRFGNMAAGAPLVRSGALLRSYLGQGPGSVEEVGETTARWGITGRVAEYARVHRGLKNGRPFRIRVTRRMRLFLGLVRGVWLRSSTKTLKIPARPHGAWTPALQQRATTILVSYVSGNPEPERA